LRQLIGDVARIDPSLDVTQDARDHVPKASRIALDKECCMLAADVGAGSFEVFLSG
jgi:hypothetical protein